MANVVTEWIAKRFAKMVGPTFISRAATSLAAVIVGFISAYGLDVDPEVVTQFASNLEKILVAAGGVISVWVVDFLFSKKDSK